MTARGTDLALAPERCDQCGRCVSTCPHGALRVGGGYLYVDSASCDSCLRCVDACGRKAITRRSAGRPIASKTGPGGARVVVGSRAEAKALRQETLDAERSRARNQSVRAKTAATRQAAARLDAVDAAEGCVAWTMLDAGAVLAVMMASLFATSAISESAAVSVMPPAGQAVARSAVLAVFVAVQLVTLSFLATRHGSRLGPAFGLARGRHAPEVVAATASMVVGLAILTRAASYLWGVIARAAGWEPPDASGLTTVFGGGGAGLLLAVIALVVLGPVAEEMAFRGVVLRATGARWGRWPAIVGTAAIFAAYHATAWTFAPMFALGVALGWLAWTRRSLWAAISLHALYNGVIVAAAYWLAR